jgi:hypothetical protein
MSENIKENIKEIIKKCSIYNDKLEERIRNSVDIGHIDNKFLIYNTQLKEIIKNSINLGYCEPEDALKKMIDSGKHTIFKTKKNLKNESKRNINIFLKSSDIILSIEANKPFRLTINGEYITPWIKSTKLINMIVHTNCQNFTNFYIETEADYFIYEGIFLLDDERNLLADSTCYLITDIDIFITQPHLIVNASRHKIWNCKRSHLKKTEKYKNLSKNTKLLSSIIFVILEYEYKAIIDPGVCTCSST